MVVPVLGRMTDSDDEIRSTATNTFASLVKMVPLEVSAFIPPAFISKKNLTMTQAGLPDPPGFSDDLFKRRDTEREFLNQLLDGSKVEQYTLPVTIKADLRKYQQDGVNWLAFLAKYQLHGILCDGMTCFEHFHFLSLRLQIWASGKLFSRYVFWQANISNELKNTAIPVPQILCIFHPS